MKLSEIHLVERKIKDVPILLLDDVLSELDVNSRIIFWRASKYSDHDYLYGSG